MVQRVVQLLHDPRSRFVDTVALAFHRRVGLVVQCGAQPLDERGRRGLARGGLDLGTGGACLLGAAEMARCYGGPPYSVVLANVLSPLYGQLAHGGSTIISDTEVFRSAALAADDLAAAGRPLGVQCLLAGYRADFIAEMPTAHIVAQ